MTKSQQSSETQMSIEFSLSVLNSYQKLCNFVVFLLPFFKSLKKIVANCKLNKTLKVEGYFFLQSFYSVEIHHVYIFQAIAVGSRIWGKNEQKIFNEIKRFYMCFNLNRF